MGKSKTAAKLGDLLSQGDTRALALVKRAFDKHVDESGYLPSGGIKLVAADLNVPHRTVLGWRTRGLLPDSPECTRGRPSNDLLDPTREWLVLFADGNGILCRTGEAATEVVTKRYPEAVLSVGGCWWDEKMAVVLAIQHKVPKHKFAFKDTWQ